MIALTGNNAFSVKKLLSVDDLTTNYLVYSPLAYNRPDDNWLLDVELYSEEFRADLISIWMDEMGLASNPAMRKQVKNYRAYFNAKDRRQKVSSQNKIPATPGTAAHGCHGGNLWIERCTAEYDSSQRVPGRTGFE